MAAATKNPIGGLLSKTAGNAATKVTGISLFSEVGKTSRKYGSDPFGSASKDWDRYKNGAPEEPRKVQRPRYTGIGV